MKISATPFKHPGRAAAAFALAAVLGAGGVMAQAAPAACVADLRKEYASSSALRAECPSDTDCTFQAPEGNASALALIGTMVKRAEACFTAAGLKVTKDDTAAQGTTRYYGTADTAEKCALLIAANETGVAQGMRAACQ
ncbi:MULTISPECIES: hypothetical protein [Rhodomicrobium]|uniref:hypothetical protein n=1 Tax=Rhodomicrobium TaxID=1068 RepID=UPI000B4A7B12|nr:MULTISPECIES: hypothetical protein [Rhodomicrobium]